MNIAIVFAGGSGKRMGNTDKPKQFMTIDDKPIIIHTIEAFEKNDNIDAIVVSILGEWRENLEKLIEEYKITKVKGIVNGGTTGQLSIFNALKEAYDKFPHNSVVLIHDGVRPFIDDNLINKNIDSVKKNGSAISIVYSTETNMIIDDKNCIMQIPNRERCVIAKAPQSFLLDNLYKVHIKAQEENFTTAIDSASLMHKYGESLYTIETDYDNIKITTPKDIAIAESIYKRKKVKE